MRSASRTVISQFSASIPKSVMFEDLGDRIRLTASEPLTSVASGRFADPAIYASVRVDELPGPASFVGYSFAQFAMPVRATTTKPFPWSPAANVDSPPAVIPLVIGTEDGTICLLAPLDAWHEQVIAVRQDEHGVNEFRWGWHGDLDVIPADSRITLGVFEGATVEEVFAAFATELGTHRVELSDPVTTHLSYWTDNGAAYWYRTEPGRTSAETLSDKLHELRQLGVSVTSVELDSWFYPHEFGRKVSDVGYLDEVPPTGMLAWTPRLDVLPDGMAPFVEQLGNPPLVLHSRHISPRSSYVADGFWWIDEAAHPQDPEFFRRWMSDAAEWGATCVEQDWMSMNWFSVGQLRAEPGRSMAWQAGLDAAAGEFGLTLIWCMATPGDLMATVELERIVAVRTCDDYRYADDPARLWDWYLTVNRLADSLGLPVSKDCFFTGADPGASGLDGDPHVEVEALLAALSSGVVGIGDRLGHTDPAIVERLCRPDGLLVKPDRPLAMASQSFFDDRCTTERDARPAWATSNSGSWRYIVALHTAELTGPVSGVLQLGERMLIYDWRAEQAACGSEIEVALEHRDWALFVCCPLTGSQGLERTVIGDPTKYATMGSTRVAVDGNGTITVSLAEGEHGLSVRTWQEGIGLQDQWVVANG